MKTSKFTEEQIAFALKQQELGAHLLNRRKGGTGRAERLTLTWRHRPTCRGGRDVRLTPTTPWPSSSCLRPRCSLWRTANCWSRRQRSVE